MKFKNHYVSKKEMKNKYYEPLFDDRQMQYFKEQPSPWYPQQAPNIDYMKEFGTLQFGDDTMMAVPIVILNKFAEMQESTKRATDGTTMEFEDFFAKVIEGQKGDEKFDFNEGYLSQEFKEYYQNQ